MHFASNLIDFPVVIVLSLILRLRYHHFAEGVNEVVISHCNRQVGQHVVVWPKDRSFLDELSVLQMAETRKLLRFYPVRSVTNRIVQILLENEIPALIVERNLSIEGLGMSFVVLEGLRL